MARLSAEERLKQIHKEALQEFDDIQAAQRDERRQCYEDRRFYSVAGAQWEGPLGEQFENKPRFEFNRVHLAVIRVINEYRANRVTVDFQSKDGEPGDEFADACDGMLRADERRCSANEAYDNAFEEGTAGGMGAWRLRACYEDEDDDENDRQTIAFEPIFDADVSVFFDLGAKRQDKADAKRCYVLSPMPRSEYEEEWGDSPGSWPRDVYSPEYDWCTPDQVWICELYRVEEVKETVIWFVGLMGDEVKHTEKELKEDPSILEELTATGYTESRRKKVERKQCRKYLMSGGKMLEDCGLVPGGMIPVIPFYGKRWVVNGIERCMGHVRLAKDAQRLTNSLMSWLADMAGRFDTEKPILTPEQVAGHVTMWSNDAVERYPYLLLNSMKDANGDPIPGSAVPMAYTKAPQLPPAMAALTQLAGESLQDLLGNQQAGEEVQQHISGKAVELIQTRLDMQVFIYMSNFAKAMKRSGEVWLAMKRAITTEESRKVKTLGPNGEASSVVLNQPFYDAETGEVTTKNDMSAARYEPDVEVGPSSSSKRAATVRALTGMMQITADPEAQQVLSGLAMMNMEGEGINDARDFYRAKMVRMGVVKPTKDEREQLMSEAQNQTPDPQSQYLLAAADQAAADAQAKRAKTVETIASAELKRAQTAQTYAEAMQQASQQQLASAQALRGLLFEPSVGSMDFNASSM
jgi:hypothetical protein